MTESPKTRRAPFIVVCVVIAFLGVTYLLIGDRTVWGAWISVAPPILFALVLIPAIVRAKSWIAAALLVAFLATTSEWPRFGAETRASHDTLRLVSWNIGAGNSSWASAVESLDPDIVLAQESSKPILMWDEFTWTGTPDPGTLTHFPVEVLPTEKVGPWVEPQLLLVEMRGKKVLVANVRLMLPSIVIQLVAPFEERPVENYRARTAQYEKLVALVQSTAETTGTDAVIIAGDFNIPARMQSIAPLRESFNDAWQQAGSGWGATVPEFLPLTRIDHVWMSENIEIVSVRVHRLAGSDHRAVVVDFDLLDQTMVDVEQTDR